MMHMSPAALPSPQQGGSIRRLALMLRLVWREVPQSFGAFSILIACIALGVGAIMAVITLSRALEDGLIREGRVILGADAAFTLVQREASAEEKAALMRQGQVSQLIQARGMARSLGDDAVLVEIKAVDAAYPVAGSLVMAGETGAETRPLAALLAQDAQGRHGIVVDPILLGRLNIRIGDALRIGDGVYAVTATLTSEPDKLSGGLGFGPRVLMSAAGISTTGLLQPGSLTRFTYRLALQPGADEATLERALAEIAKAVPDAGWQIGTRLRASPNLQRQIAQFTQFLALVGLTALLVGGVGIANAVQAFADKQVLRIATLKSLGASRRFVFASSLLQVCAFALIGISIGLGLGLLLPRLAVGFAGDLLPFALDIRFHAQEGLVGLLYGLSTTLTFALWPLLRARSIEASSLFRDDPAAPAWRGKLPDYVLMALAILAFVLVVLLSASNQRIAGYYLLAASLALLTLRLVASGVMRLARAVPHPKMPVLRLALANLHRPGSLTPSVVLSLGLGLTLLVALSLIDLNLTRQFRAALPGIAPSFFFIDIPAREMDRFEAFLKEQSPAATIERVPQLRGRILSVKGVPASDLKGVERVSWVLDGDRGITYAQTPPEGSSIASGAWWGAEYRGKPLVSFAKDVAEGLGLKVGDEISVNVLGRIITAEIANLREVRWQRLGINFVMVFSPNTFAGAPFTYLATMALPASATPEMELKLAQALGKAFPAISAVRVKDALNAVDAIVSQLSLAIRVSSGIALLASILVLGAALAASARARQREAVILKTLGATRATLLKSMLVEYAALGGIAVVFGLVCGAAGAKLVVSGLMNLDFTWPLLPSLSIAILAFITTIILGLSGTWHILGQKPAPYLRHA